jgi:hypothetical protein
MMFKRPLGEWTPYSHDRTTFETSDDQNQPFISKGKSCNYTLKEQEKNDVATPFRELLELQIHQKMQIYRKLSI